MDKPLLGFIEGLGRWSALGHPLGMDKPRWGFAREFWRPWPVECLSYFAGTWINLGQAWWTFSALLHARAPYISRRCDAWLGSVFGMVDDSAWFCSAWCFSDRRRLQCWFLQCFSGGRYSDATVLLQWCYSTATVMNSDATVRYSGWNNLKALLHWQGNSDLEVKVLKFGHLGPTLKALKVEEDSWSRRRHPCNRNNTKTREQNWVLTCQFADMFLSLFSVAVKSWRPCCIGKVEAGLKI